jgi:Flp pilus assembly protein TadG
MSNILPAVSRFARNERGSTTIIFGLMSIILFSMIGGAIDYAKWHDGFKHAEASMDSALLAAGRQLQTEPSKPQKAIEIAQVYFDNAIAQGIKVDGAVASFTIIDNGLGVEGKVTGHVKTPFLGLLSVPQLAVKTQQKVAFNAGGSSGSTLEVSLMLDVTGSMCADGQGPCTTSTKMNALKKSAKDLVNIVVRDAKNARVAVVPFSTRVRVGTGNDPSAAPMMKQLTNLDAKWTGWQNACTASTGGGGSEEDGDWHCTHTQAEHEVNWKVMPCVSDRTGPNEFTDAAPGANDWLNAHQGDRFPLSQNSGNTPYTSGLGGTPHDLADQWNYNPDASCADIGEPNVVVPLSNDAAALSSKIDGLEAYGSTAGALGTAWSWYMLSPKWSGIWSGASAPGSYGDLTVTTPSGKPKLRKIAILMTDGDYNTYRSWKDQNGHDVSNNAKSICANMKAQGIEIYSIGFELDELPGGKRSRAIDTLKSCGTDIDHFYNSLDAIQLQTAFRDIALKLSALYVAQ